MNLTKEQITILQPAVHSTWDYISADMPECDNEVAIEMVIDAGRMAMMGHNEAHKLTLQLLEDNTVDEGKSVV